MKKIAVFTSLLVICFLTGCRTPKLQDEIYAPQPPQIAFEPIETKFRYVKDTSKLKITDPNNIKPYYETKYEEAIDKKDWVQAKRLRNEIIYDVLGEMKFYHKKYEFQIREYMASTELAFDIPILTLTSIATLIEPSGTSRILTGIAAGATSAKNAVDSSIFREKQAEILIIEMQKNRELEEAKIKKKIEKDNDDCTINYTLIEAVSDLREYYFSGTVTAALVSLHENAGNIQEAEIDKIERKQNSSKTPEETTAQKENSKITLSMLGS